MDEQASDTTFAVWTGLLRASARVQAGIEAALKAEGLPPLGTYDALWEIEKAGEAGIRPFALRPRLLLPQYGLSRLIDRLVAAGHVERRPCGDDRRGHVLHLTEAGRGIRARMWPVYARALQRTLGTRISEAEAARLARALTAIAARQPP